VIEGFTTSPNISRATFLPPAEWGRRLLLKTTILALHPD